MWSIGSSTIFPPHPASLRQSSHNGRCVIPRIELLSELNSFVEIVQLVSKLLIADDDITGRLRNRWGIQCEHEGSYAEVHDVFIRARVTSCRSSDE